jgi:predicted site-specific integrase-resolvase
MKDFYNEWYTYKEVIEVTGISKQTLNNWRKNGNIIFKKLSPKTFLYQFPEKNFPLINITQENERFLQRIVYI